MVLRWRRTRFRVMRWYANLQAAMARLHETEDKAAHRADSDLLTR